MAIKSNNKRIPVDIPSNMNVPDNFLEDFDIEDTTTEQNVYKSTKINTGVPQGISLPGNMRVPDDFADTVGEDVVIRSKSTRSFGDMYKSLFKPEIGAVSTLLEPLFRDRVNESFNDIVEADQELLRMFREEQDPKKKQRLRELIEKRVDDDPFTVYSEALPAHKKSTSQALGEAISLGLLVTPLPEVKVLKSTKVWKRFVSGGSFFGAFSGAYGLAEEGELREKVPTIAMMTGTGFLAGGIFSGFVPPMVKGVGKATKKLFDKMLPPKAEKVVLPTIRKVKRRTGKTKTQPIVHGVVKRKVKTRAEKIRRINEKLRVVENKIGRSTDKERIDLVQEVTRLENEREKFINESIQNNLKQGDEIFSNDAGRIKIREFIKDDANNTAVIGTDLEGRVVTVTPDTLAGMKRIDKPKSEMVREFVDMPKLADEPIKLNKVQKFTSGLKRYVKTTQPFIEELGEPGKAFIGLLDKTIDQIDRRIGRARLPIVKMTRKLGLDKKGTKLTEEEVKNIVNLLDAGLRVKARTFDELVGASGIRPVSDRVRNVVETFSNVTKKLVSEADELGIKVRDRTTGSKHEIGEAFIHFPHIPKDIEKLKKNIPELVQLQMKRKDLSKREANALVNSFIKNYTTRRYAGLENRRTLFIEGFEELEKFGYETNPLVAVEDFVRGATRRNIEAKNFGENNELIARLIKDTRNSGYDSGLAQEVWNKYTGLRDVNVTIKSFHQALRTFQIVAKLPLSGIVNATQLINTATEFGTTNLLRGFKRYITKKTATEEAALLSGIGDNVMQRAMLMSGAETDVAQKFLRNVGFTKIESFNRIITDAAAREWAEKGLLPELIKNPTNQKLIRHAKRLGLDPRKLINRGRLTAEELSVLGQKASNSTQFRYSILDIPLFWSSPWGRTTTQFKSFAWQQGSFIKRVIIDEAREGNLHPLMTYLVTSQVAGEGVKDLRSILKGDLSFRGDMSILERAIDNTFSVGGLGLAGDLFERMYLRSKGKFYISVADLFAGPTFGDITEGLDGIADMFGGNYKAFTKFTGRQAAIASMVPQLQNVPGAGVILRVLGDIGANIITEND